MSEEIKPALTDFEWRQFHNDGKDQYLPRYFAHCEHFGMIAKHNDALDDGDPRKLTREHLRMLFRRAAADEEARAHSGDRRPSELREVANIIAALLPHEPTP